MSETYTALPVAALFFDGRVSAGQTVWLSVEAGALRLEGTGEAQVLTPDVLRVGERFCTAPWVIDCPDGARLELADHAAAEHLLAALGLGAGRGVGARPVVVVAALLLVSLITVWALTSGVPWVAREVALVVPARATQALGPGVLEALDRSVLQPTTLDEAHQQALRDRYAQLDPDARLVIYFRHSPRLGANAMALPDGSVVVTDALVRLAGHDDEIMAVIAHEAGHIAHRHHLRALIQGSLTATLVTLWLGDVSALAAAVPSVLLTQRHSREAEHEADLHAAHVLKAAGLSPESLAAMLSRIEPKDTLDLATDDPTFTRYLDSHPGLSQRLERLQRAAAAPH